jgi:DNA-binding MarR family transcriptional regulator
MGMNTANDLMTTLERLSRVLQNESHAGGLRPVQWEVLRYLALCNRFSRNPSAVTAFLGLTKGTVSQSVIALERKGLVKKQTSPEDRRNVQLELTTDGKTLLKDDPFSAMFQGALELAPVDQSTVTSGLQSILQTVLRQRGQKIFGQCKTCSFFRKDNQGQGFHCGLLDEPLSAEDSQLICVEHQKMA